MSEEKPSKQDKAFTSFLLIVLKAIEFIGYVGIVVLLIVAGWSIRQSGWQASSHWVGLFWEPVLYWLVPSGEPSC